MVNVTRYCVGQLFRTEGDQPNSAVVVRTEDEGRTAHIQAREGGAAVLNVGQMMLSGAWLPVSATSYQLRDRDGRHIVSVPVDDAERARRFSAQHVDQPLSYEGDEPPAYWLFAADSAGECHIPLFVG